MMLSAASVRFVRCYTTYGQPLATRRKAAEKLRSPFSSVTGMTVNKWIGVFLLLPLLISCGFRTAAVRSGTSEPGGGHVKPMYGVRTKDRVVFLTIDDGVTRDPGMAGVLRDAGIRATFFLTAQYVRADPAFFGRLARETGSLIENHTLTHPNLKGRSAADQRKEICGASDDYARDFGRRPTLLRPPYGSHDPTTFHVAADCGIAHIVNWSAEVANGRMAFAVGDRLRPGDIVLAHFRRTFAEDIAEFVRQFRRAGLEPALLEDYVGNG